MMEAIFDATAILAIAGAAIMVLAFLVGAIAGPIQAYRCSRGRHGNRVMMKQGTRLFLSEKDGTETFSWASWFECPHCHEQVGDYWDAKK